MDLKKTVNLPKTAFGMKANLAQMEPKLLERWKAEDLYAQIRAARKDSAKGQYVLHDGPPYANGNIHLGHAFNKTLKDLIVKSKTMMGYDSPYTPGWDCHGLPIEIKVDGELGSKKRSMSAVEIRQACRAYAQKYVDLQRKDFIRLGVFGDWANPYLTMEAGYQAEIARAFVEFFDRGYVYKGLKPVNWCMNCRTALAEAEVEHENHTSPSIWVRFALTSHPAAIDNALAGKRVYGLIWTTTPWTIPANLGIAYHPKFEYVAIEVGGDVYIVAEGLREATAVNLGWDANAVKVVAKFNGAQLDGTVFRHPFLDRDSKGLLGDHVTLEQGTGAVHTAPGHGHEDYVVGHLQYGLPVYCPVDGAGRLFQAEGAEGQLPAELLGKSVWEANPIVIGILEARGALLGQKKIEHSYPHCWRCHKPTIFRGTEQWFIAMDHADLRAQALAAIANVKWIPEWGEGRITHMVQTRPDWCISRQRLWGVPIIAFTCAGCKTLLRDRKALDHVVDLFKEHSADVWYAREAAGLLPDGVKCAQCGSAEFTKENDILDVWFDSGASHKAVLGNTKFNLPWPADLYLEGGDQYRGWFMSSLLEGVVLDPDGKGRAPYRECATPGWTLDGEGRALSKSRGEEAVEKSFNKFGADVLRLWVSSVEFTEDVRISDTILERLTEAYRKLRNTFRYGLGNLADFDPATDSVATADLREIDQFMLMRADALVEKALHHYERFEFHRFYQAIYNFATVELSSFYFDIIKDVLYTSAPNARARRSAQTALYRITHALLRLIAPLLTFTAEEAWGQLPKSPADPNSVHLALFPQSGEWNPAIAGETAADWSALVELRDPVLKKLETARQEKVIGSGLEARVALNAKGDQWNLLKRHESELAALFIVSHVDLAEGEFAVEVHPADGTKCERCWKFTKDVGSSATYPTVCAHCARALTDGFAQGAWPEAQAGAA